MKRAVFLQPLSREHHHALVLARKAVRWASENDSSGWQEVREAFRSGIARHFHVEETTLLPMLAGTHNNLVEETMRDHERLRELALEGHTMAELEEFGERLRKHVRFEERVLFPALEQVRAKEEPGPHL